MKSRILIAFVVLMMVFTTAVAFSGGKKEASKVLKIGYTPPTLDKADFMGQFEQGMIQFLDEWTKKEGIKYELFSRSPADHAAHEQQLQIVEDFLTIGVNYVVMIPTHYEGQLGAYRKINQEGVPLVIGNYSDPFPKEWGVNAIRFAGYSHNDAGTAMANYLKGKYPNGTSMAIIYGVPGKVSDERGAKQQHTANGFNIVYEDYADWNRVKAYDATERLLTAYPNVKVIIACSSAMAVGAVQAVGTAGLTGKIDIYGAGATIEEIDMILDGRLKAAWFRDPIKIGGAAAEAVKLHYEGREKDISLVWNVPIDIVDGYDAVVRLVNPVTFTSMNRPWPPVKK